MLPSLILITAMMMTIVADLALVSARRKTSTHPCPSKWIYYRPRDTCLRSFLEKRVNFSDAERRCKRETELSQTILSDVASIADTKMLNFIHRNVVDTNQYYTWIRQFNTNISIGGVERWKMLLANANSNKKQTPSLHKAAAIPSAQLQPRLQYGSKELCFRLQNKKHIDRECQKNDAFPLCEMTPVTVADLCLTGNGGCSHICVPKSFRKRKCACPAGFVLLNGETTCKNISSDNNDDLCYPGNAGCDHFCEKAMKPDSFNETFKCSCASGYELRNLTRCVDVDECLDGANGGCQHNCTNTEGSRNCTCAEGFTPINETDCEWNVNVTLNANRNTVTLIDLRNISDRDLLDIERIMGDNQRKGTTPNYHQQSLIVSMYIGLCIFAVMLVLKGVKTYHHWRGDSSGEDGRQSGNGNDDGQGLGKRSVAEVEMNGLGGML